MVLDDSVEAFVDRLYEAWTAIGSQSVPNSSEENPFGNGSVFISYATEDRAAANHLYEEMRSIGLPVWLDIKALQAGEEWAAGIESNLRNCSIFIPLITAASDTTDETRYFRQEWTLALKLKADSGLDILILPVQVSPVSRDSSKIPQEFRKLHWIEAPEGNITDEGLARINETYRKTRYL